MTDTADTFDTESDALIAQPSPEKIDTFAAKWAGHEDLEMVLNSAEQQLAGGVDDFYTDVT